MRAGDEPRVRTGAAPARAALAGNPSDGYGGGVLAVCVHDFVATAELTVVAGRPGEIARVTPRAAAALVGAAAAQHATATGRVAPALTANVRTTIPREVGLGGSSAIVVATLRALDALAATTVPRDQLPVVALAAEHALGIAAGLQDRVAQAYGGLTAMTFGAGTFSARALDPALLPPLFVAWAPAGSAPSGAYHAELRARWDAGDPKARATMRRLAGAAASAAEAVERGDPEALGAAMDESHDLRAALGPLDPGHVALIRAARELGLSANYTGSGGAIVGVATDRERVAALRARVQRLGAQVVEAVTG